MYLLIHDVTLNVRITNKPDIDIIISLGICKGDYTSALFFILHLAFVMKFIHEQFYSRTLWSALDWLTERQKESGLYINKNKIEEYLTRRKDDPGRKELKIP